MLPCRVGCLSMSERTSTPSPSNFSATRLAFETGKFKFAVSIVSGILIHPDDNRPGLVVARSEDDLWLFQNDFHPTRAGIKSTLGDLACEEDKEYSRQETTLRRRLVNIDNPQERDSSTHTIQPTQHYSRMRPDPAAARP